MNLNYLPIIGWFLSFLFSVFISIPFWFLWTRMEYGKTFFGFLPAQFQVINFWDCVALFIIFSILKSALLPNVNNSNDVNLKDKD